MRTNEEDGQVSMFGAESVCSKMFPDFCPQTTAKTSEPSWKKLQGSHTRPFLFLDLTAGSGQAREPLSVTDGLLRGECTTLDFGESRNGGEDSLFSPTSMACLPLRSCLSAILEKNPDPKYNLSPKACQGILNRADRRGKKLPEALRIALERQAHLPSETTTTDGSLPMNPSRSTLVGGENRQPNLMQVMRNESDSILARDYKNPQCAFEEKPTAFSIGSMNSEGMKSDNPNAGFYETETGRTLDENGGNPAAYQGGIAVVYDARGNGNGEIAPTMTGDHQNRVTDYTAVVCEDKAQGFPLGFRPENVRVYDETATTVCNGTRPGFTCGVIKSAVCVGNGQANRNFDNEVVAALNCMHDQQAVMVHAVDCRNGTEDPDTNGTLQAKSNGGTSYNLNNIVRESVVRRLTPTECTRLQAFPDGWVDIGEWTDEKGKKHMEADAPKYRALGNSIALPFWFWLLKRISAHCAEKTMGSLFDGIGGFPLCWQFINGDGSVRWSSEIEPFCIAVLKQHFGDEETGQKGDWETYVDRNGNEA